MVRGKAISTALALTLLGAGTLSACGADEAELLPGETASQINANLELVEDLVGAGDCVGAENAAAAVSEQVESLNGVDPELQETLARGAARLNAVIGECEEAPEASEDETAVEDEPELRDLERQEREEEREQEQAEREAEQERREEEKEDAERETPPDEGDGEGESGEAPPAGETEPPSGGVGPGTPAEGAE